MAGDLEMELLSVAESLDRMLSNRAGNGDALSGDVSEDRLVQAGALIRAAYETLRPDRASPSTPDTEPTVLRDGYYEGGTQDLFVALRVDEGLSGVISADLFSVGVVGRSYIASIRTMPGTRIALREGSWAIVGQSEGDPPGRSMGKLTLRVEGTDGSTLVGTLYLDGPLPGLRVRREISFILTRASDLLRTLSIEMEVEVGVAAPAPYVVGNRSITIEEALRDAGIDAAIVGQIDTIPQNAAGWDLSQLHTLMQDFAQNSLLRRAWELHLLVLARSTSQGLLGVMFDSAEPLPRQGAAVFVDEIRGIAGIDTDRKVLQTTVHELGHALNLAHRFERSVGRADSTSFMNYDWRYRGGQRRQEFWTKFNWVFDPDELEFLRHGPLPALIPGGAPFHSINYWADANGGYSPYFPEQPLAGFRLSLAPPVNGPIFAFAQPIFLDITLTNVSGQPVDLPPFLLDPKAGFLEIVVRRRTGDMRSGFAGGNTWVPVVQRCFDWDLAQTQRVSDQNSISNNLNLTYGSGGFAFAEPGSYDVTAFLVIPFPAENPQMELVARSETIQIRVATPKTDAEEQDAVQFFRNDVGLYLALGGSAALPKAAEALGNIVERRTYKKKGPLDPVAASVIRAQAIHAKRRYIRYHDGKFVTDEPNLERANALLGQLDDQALRVFDAQTAKETRLLAEQTKAAVDG